MKEPLDILIRNALVYDGGGGGPFKASVGIRDARIVYIGNDKIDSSGIIDSDGLALCPGFIDTHSHSEFSILAAPQCESKIMQGVTTEINGNCGLSAAPLLGEAGKRREADLNELEISERWSEFAGYLDILQMRNPSINFATLTGHNNLRASVKGYAGGRADDNEISKMAELARKSFDSGSLGLSTGLIYPPGIFTDTEELLRLVRAINRGEKLMYTSHMRSEGDRLIESIEEVLTICREGRARVHISHIKTAGKKNWHKVDVALDIINSAVDEGLEVTFDRYPYTGSSTDLDTLLPSWAYEGGNDEECRRLRDKSTRKRFVEHMKSAHEEKEYYGSVVIASVYNEENRWMEGRSVLDVAGATGLTPEDAVIDILLKENLRVTVIFLSMSEDNLRKFLVHPRCMIGSDSSVRSFEGVTAKGKPHPRGFGTFPRFLGKYVIGEGLMSLKEGIRRITSLPAETFGIKDRGKIREGYCADIVILDPESIKDTATYEEPFRKPQGIEYVIVNGKVVVHKGMLNPNAKPGMIIKADNI